MHYQNALGLNQRIHAGLSNTCLTWSLSAVCSHHPSLPPPPSSSCCNRVLNIVTYHPPLKATWNAFSNKTRYKINKYWICLKKQLYPDKWFNKRAFSTYHKMNFTLGVLIFCQNQSKTLNFSFLIGIIIPQKQSLSLSPFPRCISFKYISPAQISIGVPNTYKAFAPGHLKDSTSSTEVTAFLTSISL